MLDEPLVGLGFFDGVEVLALDVLDEGDLERFRLRHVADDDRQLVQARPLRGAPSPLAGDEEVSVAVPADEQWKEHAAAADRLAQFL